MNKIRQINENIKGDKIIWAVVIVLSVFSLLSVYSSMGSVSHSWNVVIKHAVILMFSFALIYLAHLIPYTYYSKIAVLLLIVTVPLIIITVLFGKSMHGAVRAIEIPLIGFRFQTFDFAKLAIVMFVARHLSKNQDNPSDLKKSILPILIPVLLLLIPIVRFDFSTAVLIIVVVITLMFIGRVKIKYLAVFFGILFLSFGSLYILAKTNPDVLPRMTTWLARLDDFSLNFFESKEKEEYMSPTQSNFVLYAIADGKVFGVMPGHSKARNDLANAPSDFIFAIIIEEYGFLGGFLIILCYLILFFRVIKIALKTEKFFGTLLIIGCGLLVVMQAFTNIGYTVGVLPTTGLTLPFISMGGASLWFTAIAIGIILSISRDVDNKKSANKNNNAYAEV